MARTKVTVWLQTFNHEPWVRGALDSILCQDFDGHWELVVHDDASTDRTQHIVRERLQESDVPFRPIFQAENQYSQGRRALDFLDPSSCGEFIAILEGDDAWSDATKLRRQVAALEAQPDVDLSFHRAHVVGSTNHVRGDYGESDRRVSLQDVLGKAHGDIPTGSLLIRTQAFAEMQRFCREHPGLPLRDVYLQAFGAARGGAWYIARAMAVYRMGVAGSWTERQRASRARFAHYQARVEGLRKLKGALPASAQPALDRELRKWTRRIFTCELTTPDQRRGYLSRNWTELGTRDRAVGLVGSYAPVLVDGARNARRAIRSRARNRASNESSG